MEEKLNEIYNKMIEISGPHTNIKNNTNKIRNNKDIYASFHYPEFTKLNSLRNTLIRFEEFKIKNLDNKIIFDIGCNIGALSFEALRRNAKKVIGFEYCIERVNICNELIKALKVNVEFNQYDFNNFDEDNFYNTYNKADFVFCCAIDAYIDNKDKFYKFISNITKECCYFETNSNIKENDFIDIMKNNGFDLIISLGMSKSDSGYGRKSYILLENLSEKKTRYENSIYNKKIYFDENYYYYKYENNVIINKIKTLYDKIKHIEYVQNMEFYNNIIITPNYKCHTLDKIIIDENNKISIKNQLIEFIRELNICKIAHRDLHIKNVLYDGNKIIVIDWEFIEINDCDLVNCYDLTGKGLDSPLKTSHMNIFKNHIYSFETLLKNLNIEEFIKK